MKVNVLRINKGRAGAESGAKIMFGKEMFCMRLKCTDVRTNGYENLKSYFCDAH